MYVLVSNGWPIYYAARRERLVEKMADYNAAEQACMTIAANVEELK